ncbi:hypothetical protein I7X30_05560 [Capnocytophaga sp. 051621]|uniref:Uncharacterized protein n=2 Tax=Capnocytophaga TaxID=1016 RepID=A0ABS1YTJ1_9FLAO|nr:MULTISPECIES: hypothetical protein [Capnocytophaga]MBI1646524.1 hypothetical protein [Capnocytophaga periodontitidis]MBM0649340.1 hypothetical protein [Capnocytophaga genosp. AHN8471]MBM0661314.1 hypothetical protein [Capnocytophaga genosp. AHN8471]
MMNVLYYYIYLFNVKFLPYTFPDLNTVWILGSLFALIVNSSLNMGLAYFFGYTLGRFQILSIIILLVIFFHFKYDRSGRGKRIVKKEKPKFLGSNIASIILTILFFLISISFFLFSEDVVREILEKKKATTLPM